ncbi:MAG: hypothetical protein GC137_08050 [Alphaproteobacteria bacterium]|nr:hypothetical protein [Alphaproteobacteria bacterium]
MAHNKKTLKPTEELSARMMAVQACYEMLHNKKPYRTVLKSYLDRGLELDGEFSDDLPAPKISLFKKIMDSYNARSDEIEQIVMANVTKSEENEVEKGIEPLLKAIFLCGVTEILMNHEADNALIINDYLDVCHSFYSHQQVSFVNGVLDTINKAIEGA